MQFQSASCKFRDGIHAIVCKTAQPGPKNIDYTWMTGDTQKLASLVAGFLENAIYFLSESERAAYKNSLRWGKSPEHTMKLEPWCNTLQDIHDEVVKTVPAPDPQVEKLTNITTTPDECTESTLTRMYGIYACTNPQ